MKYLIFSGSLRTESLNKKLTKVIAKIINETEGSEAMIVDIKSLSIPVYDGDIETIGIPDGVHELGDMIVQADGVIICTPEYNGSIPGSLKNTIDWISRLRPMPFVSKPVLLTGASTGGYGAISGMNHSRAPFVRMESYLYPQMFGLAKADEAFGGEGELKDVAIQKRLETLVGKFIVYAIKFKD